MEDSFDISNNLDLDKLTRDQLYCYAKYLLTEISDLKLTITLLLDYNKKHKDAQLTINFD